MIALSHEISDIGLMVIGVSFAIAFLILISAK